jgi:hypothetical protein
MRRTTKGAKRMGPGKSKAKVIKSVAKKIKNLWKSHK